MANAILRKTRNEDMTISKDKTLFKKKRRHLTDKSCWETCKENREGNVERRRRVFCKHHGVEATGVLKHHGVEATGVLLTSWSGGD